MSQVKVTGKVRWKICFRRKTFTSFFGFSYHAQVCTITSPCLANSVSNIKVTGQGQMENLLGELGPDHYVQIIHLFFIS